MHDLGDLLLARSVGPGDQHGGIGTGDAGGERDDAVHRLAGIHEAAQVVAILQLVAGARALGPQAMVLERELSQAQHVLDGGDDLGVVPWLGQVVGRALLDQQHRGLERGPRGHQQDRQVAVELAQAAKQCGALLAGGRVVAKVHVLNNGADVTAGDRLERGLGGVGDDRGDAVHVEQDLERRADGGVIVDDQDLLHDLSVVPASGVAGRHEVVTCRASAAYMCAGHLHAAFSGRRPRLRCSRERPAFRRAQRRGAGERGARTAVRPVDAAGPEW